MRGDESSAGKSERPSSSSQGLLPRPLALEIARVLIPSAGFVWLGLERTDVPWWAPFFALVFISVPGARDAMLSRVPGLNASRCNARERKPT